jgi:hypothetical protein
MGAVLTVASRLQTRPDVIFSGLEDVFLEARVLTIDTVGRGGIGGTRTGCILHCPSSGDLHGPWVGCQVVCRWRKDSLGDASEDLTAERGEFGDVFGHDALIAKFCPSNGRGGQF